MMKLSIERPGLTLVLGLTVTALSGAFYRQMSRPIVPQNLPNGDSAYTVLEVGPGGAGRRNDFEALSPALLLDQLKEYQARPPASVSRDLFEFYAPRGTGPGNYEPQRAASRPSPPVPSRRAPAAPRLALRYLGYSESTRGETEAILKDEKRLYVVHEGDRIGRHFVVTRITSSVVEIQDEQTQLRQQFRFIP